jgi:hypothetical protein
LQAVGQAPDRHLANVLDLEEIDDLLHAMTVLQFLAQRRSAPDRLGENVALLQRDAARHDVVERCHALEQGDVLEGARDPLPGRVRSAHGASLDAAKGDRALLRRVEAVDNVQHRGLAGAVRTDNGADLALADIEGDLGDRLDAAEAQRHVLDLEQHAALGDAVVVVNVQVPRIDGPVHSAASLIGLGSRP